MTTLTDRATIATGAVPSALIAREPWLKRPFDVVLASFGMLTSGMLWLLIAIAIRREDGGPVFYTQMRWGRGGKPFKAYKFRTMTAYVDKIVGVRPANEKDQYVTRTGRLLRKTGMDELPQFLNILRGDMSFVGPRALAVDEMVEDSAGRRVRYADLPAFAQRQAVRPGLTSIATVFASKYTTTRRKFAYDMLYAQRMSFGLDLWLIYLSFWISFRGKWESQQPKL